MTDPIPRMYTKVIENYFKSNRQMLFVSGPRQSGKTTVSLMAGQRTERFLCLPGIGHLFLIRARSTKILSLFI